MMTGDFGYQSKQSKRDSDAKHTDEQSKDEVDFVPMKLTHPNYLAKSNGFKQNDNSVSDLAKSNECNFQRLYKLNDTHNKSYDSRSQQSNHVKKIVHQQPEQYQQLQQPEHTNSSIEKNSLLLPFHRKKSDPTNLNTTLFKDKPKFNKSASLARLFGNSYSTQHSTAHNQQKNELVKTDGVKTVVGNNHTSLNTERFIKCSENHVDDVHRFDGHDNRNSTMTGTSNNKLTSKHSVQYKDFCDEKDLSVRALRSISKSLGKLWRRSHSVEISAPDPEYKVLYLGNVLTGWAKGDSCIEKPLATLWRNYTQNNKPDVVMRITVCCSGLKATTRQHGLTEYWSNRVTHCSSPKNYPRIFCWIYRHEGRKLKHELRCHAVLCPKESIAEEICQTLKSNLVRALQEFKRDKINRQNARLSLVNSVYENPSMPRRKILLSVGANNYRPPMERSKSAPKLMAIEEAVGEEDEGPEPTEEIRPSCCKIDPLFPAMTLGRKHCRRGHSIRKQRAALLTGSSATLQNRRSKANNEFRIRSVSFDDDCLSKKQSEIHQRIASKNLNKSDTKKHVNSNELDDEDDFNSLLLVNDYDVQSSLSGELMSYFDSKLKPSLSMSELALHRSNEVSMDTNLKLLSHRAAVSLDDLDNFDDDEFNNNDYCLDEYDRMSNLQQDDNQFYEQNKILDCLVNTSRGKIGYLNDNDIANVPNSDDFNANQYFDDKHMLSAGSTLIGNRNKRPNLAMMIDSDEGSISSGCETSSTVTSTHFEEIMKLEKEQNQSQIQPSNQNPCTRTILDVADNINSDLLNHNDNSQNEPNNRIQNPNSILLKSSLKNRSTNNDEDCNSEYSDESGFDEFQNFAANKQNSIDKRFILKQLSSTEDGVSSCTSTSIKDDNKSIKTKSITKSVNSACEFEPSNKNSTRLMINIPKNAKSILI